MPRIACKEPTKRTPTQCQVCFKSHAQMQILSHAHVAKTQPQRPRLLKTHGRKPYKCGAPGCNFASPSASGRHRHRKDCELFLDPNFVHKTFPGKQLHPGVNAGVPLEGFITFSMVSSKSDIEAWLPEDTPIPPPIASPQGCDLNFPEMVSSPSDSSVTDNSLSMDFSGGMTESPLPDFFLRAASPASSDLSSESSISSTSSVVIEPRLLSPPFYLDFDQSYTASFDGLSTGSSTVDFNALALYSFIAFPLNDASSLPFRSSMEDFSLPPFEQLFSSLYIDTEKFLEQTLFDTTLT
ncbi:uncharacterized protein BT62DRAFT_922615 [Guyanagaster necrorhizus]|uniref:Uncharacterized protein n=1 Tax=Guyanagaster necrorhizus TaxID=856835 RepID=A0A9P8ANL3_9AGAR|nr:uncharacterized protein BT62DRAFT_922615 [Guyanagaster necrorhizus MCA 3950]KAG7442428.1 hypothetical protein BT62DRAFT_922615 [Guyanagaster necrorhizus MCA 3950]